MSAFLRQAEEIFETARRGGDEEADWTILVDGNGGLFMVAGREWDVEAMRLDSGARSAFRVSRNQSGVTVEARTGSESCRLESPRRAARRDALPEFPGYLLVS